ncbi:transposase [Streptomyces sp. NPDC059893]|uniref:transposase n=1 Tax=Streptomyces sp. NPDC059893 TaxID=3346990 RepID=UPI00364C51D3
MIPNLTGLGSTCSTRVRGTGARTSVGEAYTRWFAADEVYCGRELRRDIRALNLDYTVGVAATHQVTDGTGRRWKPARCSTMCGLHSGCAWPPVTAPRGGASTTRVWLDIRADDTPRRTGCRHQRSSRPPPLHGRGLLLPLLGTGPPPLATLVEIICRRWRIEETFQLAKGHAGLGQGQVTCWNSWIRWSLFSLVATTVLALILAAASEKTGEAQPARLIPLTCPELLRLLRVLVLPAPVPRPRPHAALDRLAASPPGRRHRLPLWCRHSPPRPRRSGSAHVPGVVA